MYISTTHKKKTLTQTHIFNCPFGYLIGISNLTCPKQNFLIAPIYSSPSVPHRSIWPLSSTQLLRTKTLVLSLTPFFLWQYFPSLSIQTTSYYPFLLPIRSTFKIHLKSDQFSPPPLFSLSSKPPSFLIQTTVITSQFPASSLIPYSSVLHAPDRRTIHSPNPPIKSLHPEAPSFITVCKALHDLVRIISPTSFPNSLLCSISALSRLHILQTHQTPSFLEDFAFALPPALPYSPLIFLSFNWSHCLMHSHTQTQTHMRTVTL